MSDVHLTPDQLEDYVLDPVAASVHDDHLSTCGVCQGRLAREAQLELELAEVAKAAPRSRRTVRRGVVAGVVSAAMAAVVAVLAVAAVKASRVDEQPLVGPTPVEPQPGVRPYEPETRAPVALCDAPLAPDLRDSAAPYPFEQPFELALLADRKHDAVDDILRTYDARYVRVLVALTGHRYEDSATFAKGFTTDLCKMSGTERTTALTMMAAIYTTHPVQPSDVSFGGCEVSVNELLAIGAQHDDDYTGAVMMLANQYQHGLTAELEAYGHAKDNPARRVMALSAMVEAGHFAAADVLEVVAQRGRLDERTGPRAVLLLRGATAGEIPLVFSMIESDPEPLRTAAGGALTQLSQVPGATEALLDELLARPTLQTERGLYAFRLLDASMSTDALSAVLARMREVGADARDIETVQRSVEDWRKRAHPR